MEVYNSLSRQFHDSLTPRNNLIQYKRLADQLICGRAGRKAHLVARLKQLEEGENRRKCTLDSSRSIDQSRTSVRSRSSSHTDMGRIEEGHLKRKIVEIQHKIMTIRSQTNELNSQLSMFQHRNDEIEMVGRRSEMDAANTVHELYLEASRQDEQSLKEQQTLAVLSKKRELVASRINSLVKQKELNQSMIHELSLKNKNQSRLEETGLLGENGETLKGVVQVILQLQELMKQYDTEDGAANKHIGILIRKDLDRDHIVETVGRMSSKGEIIDFLANRQICPNDHLATKIIDFYNDLQQELERKERANEQINSQLSHLAAQYDKLAEIISTAALTSQQETQQSLKQTEVDLNRLEHTLLQKCQLITHSSTQFHFLLRKLQSLNLVVQEIISSTPAGMSGKFKVFQTNQAVVRQYQELLNKNPEDEKVRWHEALLSNDLFYTDFIGVYDLLRLFASPEGYNPRMDNLSNFQIFMLSAFRSANAAIKKMVTEILAYFKHYAARSSHKLKHCMTTTPQEENFCIESDDYYRRDNYKLIEKAGKIELKKKGLLVSIPFHVSLDNQFVNDDERENRHFEAAGSPGSRSNRKYMKYTDLATRRQENSLKGRSLRNLFGRLRTISSSRNLQQLSSIRSPPVIPNSVYNASAMKKAVRTSKPRKSVTPFKEISHLF